MPEDVRAKHLIPQPPAPLPPGFAKFIQQNGTKILRLINSVFYL